MSTISLAPDDYRFATDLRVRLSETDAVGIVYFGSFATYFDVGRMEYLNHLGLHTFDGPVRDLIPGVVVHQEAHFHAPAHYHDDLQIHVRIAELGRTSYTFHLLATHRSTRRLLASGSISLVWLDANFAPTPLPERFRMCAREFEGQDLVERGARAPAVHR